MQPGEKRSPGANPFTNEIGSDGGCRRRVPRTPGVRSRRLKPRSLTGAAAPAAERRAVLSSAPPTSYRSEPRGKSAGLMTQETGATFAWGAFNCELAATFLREAATHVDCVGAGRKDLV